MIRTKMDPLSIIVTVDEVGGFTKDGKIPWNKTKDLKHFRKITNGNVCIMGRSTYEYMYGMAISRKKNKDPLLPVKIDNILPNRQSFVVSSTVPELEGATVIPRLRQAIQSLDEEDTREVFILGGYRLFIEALPWVNTIYLTVIRGIYNCDKKFPIAALKDFIIEDGEYHDDMCFLTYKRRIK